MWVTVNDALTAVRMPTLFAISGFLLSSRIRKGWSDPRTRFSAAHSLYLYLIWLVIYALVAPWFPTGAQPLSTSEGWLSLGTQLFNPHTMLWFILGLVFWTVVLATVRFLPSWVILPALFLVTALSLEIEWATQLDFYIRILRYGFYFAVGVYLRPAMEKAINDHVWLTAGCSLAGYVIVRLAAPIEDVIGLPISVLTPLRDLAALGLAMSVLAASVSRVSLLRAPLVWVGERTLPIYVLHSLVIWTLVKIPGWGVVMKLPLHKYVAPVLWTAIVAAVCIAVYFVAMKTPARYLFDMPKSWRAALRREKVSS